MSMDLFAPAPMAATALDGEVSPAAAGAKNCGTCGRGKPNAHSFVICGEGKSSEWLRPDAPCQFPRSRWMVLSPEKKARVDAQAGIDQAAAAAERAHAGWGDTADAFIGWYCVTKGKGHHCTGHDIVQASIERGIDQPPNSKAWGAPIQRAARGAKPLLKRIGYTEDENRHGAPIPLWEVL